MRLAGVEPAITWFTENFFAVQINSTIFICRIESVIYIVSSFSEIQQHPVNCHNFSDTVRTPFGHSCISPDYSKLTLDKLTVKEIDNARSKDKPYELTNSDSLQLRVAVDGEEG